SALIVPRGWRVGTRPKRAALPTLQINALIMFVTMIMMMLVVIMVMMVIMTVIVVIVGMPALVMVDALVRAAGAGILAEQQRLERHRHGVGRHADAAEVDVVEVAQDNAVDGEHLALDVELLAQYGAERLRDVAVEHDVDRLLRGDGVGQPAADSF